MPPTLASAREEFARSLSRDNVASDRPRLLAVLDAVLAWSAAHPELVRFQPDRSSAGTIRFEAVGTHSIFWTATPRRHNVPLLQILPGSSAHLSEVDRADALSRLNAQTREPNPAQRLQIGFGALKNPAGRAAVFALMEELLGKVQSSRTGAAKAPREAQRQMATT